MLRDTQFVEEHVNGTLQDISADPLPETKHQREHCVDLGDFFFAHPTWIQHATVTPVLTTDCLSHLTGHPFKSSRGAEISTQSASGMIPPARKMPTRRLTWVADSI